MYGVIAGDLAGFPYEYRHTDLTDKNIPLFSEAETVQQTDAGKAGTLFSDKTVMTAAIEQGLLQFEKNIPEVFAGKRGDAAETAEKTGSGSGPENSFEEAFALSVEQALRKTGRSYPLAGYAMDLSIWLFREGAPKAEEADAEPAVRAIPVAWMFQEDLYMMRHLARQQAKTTHRSRDSIRASDAAACAVFFAIHGLTKEYIARYIEQVFQYRTADEETMRKELLQAGERGWTAEEDIAAAPASPAAGRAVLCVRAALTAFLHGRDFEDVLRRAVSLGGRSSEIAAVAGGIAEAYFGMPEEIRDFCRSRLPADLRASADAFSARIQQKKEAREADPEMQARWESALTRASERHPAAVQGNEPLEEAIGLFLGRKDQQALINVLETIRLRMHEKSRVFVPLISAKRAEQVPAGATAGPTLKEAGQVPAGAAAGATAKEVGQVPAGAAAGPTSKEAGRKPVSPAANPMLYRMQAIRTRNGKLWQPVYTSRAQLDKARAAGGSKEEMVLSYSLEALLKRFLPVPPEDSRAGGHKDREPGLNGEQEKDRESGLNGEQEKDREAGLNGEQEKDRESGLNGEKEQGREPGLNGEQGQESPSNRLQIPASMEGIAFNPYDKAFFLPRSTIAALFVVDREAGRVRLRKEQETAEE